MMNSGLDNKLQITGTSLDDLGIEEYVDHQWDYVDMGSAGKWMKYNLGSTTEEGYGDYYAWGEVDTYYQNWTDRTTNPTEWKSGKTSGYAWQSYCGSTGFVEWSTVPYDSTTLVLKNEYDVLYQKSGGKFRMPTYDELTALRDDLTSTWTTLNGVYGMRFTATNGNTLFIPAAGYLWNGAHSGAGDFCFIWSCSRRSSEKNCSNYCTCYIGGLNMGGMERFCGSSVRGVLV